MARSKNKQKHQQEERSQIEGEGGVDAEAASDDTPEARLAALTAEVESLREKYLRAQADYQNLRRRASEERNLELRRTLTPLLTELLFVLDFLDMALAVPATTDEAKNIAIGVDMTRARFLQALENAGVATITAEGRFDAALHEAAQTEVTAEVEPGTILRTIRRGYTWNELVLRHAQVVVAADPEGAPTEARMETRED